MHQVDAGLASEALPLPPPARQAVNRMGRWGAHRRLAKRMQRGAAREMKSTRISFKAPWLVWKGCGWTGFWLPLLGTGEGAAGGWRLAAGGWRLAVPGAVSPCAAW
jgi:hypothetical protein